MQGLNDWQLLAARALLRVTRRIRRRHFNSINQMLPVVSVYS
jgi:hypothetical protein